MTVTLKAVVPTGLTSAKAFVLLTDELADGGESASLEYGSENTALCTVVWADLADGDYTLVFFDGTDPITGDTMRVTDDTAVLLSNPLAAAADYVIVDGFSTDGRAQLVSALTAATEDGELDEVECIPVIAGDDWRLDFENIGDLSGYSNLIFGMKNSASDADADALILIDKETGLLIADGEAGNAEHGTITLTDVVLGTGYIIVKAEATDGLASGKKYSALKLIASSGAIRRVEKWRPCITIVEGVVDANS